MDSRQAVRNLMAYPLYFHLSLRQRWQLVKLYCRLVTSCLSSNSCQKKYE